MWSTIHTCAWYLAILFHLSPCILLPTTSSSSALQPILALPHPYHRLLPHHSQCMPPSPIIFLFVKVRSRTIALFFYPLQTFVRFSSSLRNVTYQRRHQKSNGKVQRYFPTYSRAEYNNPSLATREWKYVAPCAHLERLSIRVLHQYHTRTLEVHRVYTETDNISSDIDLTSRKHHHPDHKTILLSFCVVDWKLSFLPTSIQRFAYAISSVSWLTPYVVIPFSIHIENSTPRLLLSTIADACFALPIVYSTCENCFCSSFATLAAT